MAMSDRTNTHTHTHTRRKEPTKKLRFEAKSQHYEEPQNSRYDILSPCSPLFLLVVTAGLLCGYGAGDVSGEREVGVGVGSLLCWENATVYVL